MEVTLPNKPWHDAYGYCRNCRTAVRLDNDDTPETRFIPTRRFFGLFAGKPKKRFVVPCPTCTWDILCITEEIELQEVLDAGLFEDG